MFMENSQEKKRSRTMTVLFMLVMVMIIMVIPFVKDWVAKMTNGLI
jgi:predicted nucleic acid-binding Zn ribbon protein